MNTVTFISLLIQGVYFLEKEIVSRKILIQNSVLSKNCKTKRLNVKLMSIQKTLIDSGSNLSSYDVNI